MKSRDEIIHSLSDLPCLPAAAVRVLEMLDNEDVGIADIMAAVEIDPLLTSNVLKLANSAYYAGPRTIGDLTQAGVLLGSKRIQQVVLAAAIFPVAGKQLKGYDLAPGALLEHLLATALGTEELANELGLKLPGYGFTAALLHDIGKIALGTFVEVDVEPILKVAREENMSFEEAERIVLGIDHAEAGALLMESWHLPPEIAEVARCHHAPECAHLNPTLVNLVHIADAMSISSGIGVGTDGLQYRPSAHALQALGLGETALEEIICRMLISLEGLRPQLIGERP